jgi:hypothetical protein
VTVYEHADSDGANQTPRCARHPAWDRELCGDCAEEHVTAKLSGRACTHCDALPTQEEYDEETERLLGEAEER